MSSERVEGRLLRRGKVKDIYDVGGDKLLFVFTDRISAFDVILPSVVPRKGEILCRFAAYWFNTLGVEHHMVELNGRNRMIVWKLDMIPIECVVRGYMYGSLYERVKMREVSLPYKLDLADKLHEPLFDPTTKYEAKDVPVSKEEILERGWLSINEYDEVVSKSVGIYLKIAERADKAGFIAADLKLEFGRKDGRILLADSIGPDEFRLWPKDQYAPCKPQVSYDKQLVRDWLIGVGYKEKLDQAVKKKLPPPPPPYLPEDLIAKTAELYITAYEKLTGLKFEAEGRL